MRILITGGAGFVGSSICRNLKEAFPTATVVAFDNLKRRGSEINVMSFKSLGIEFIHGDIRQKSDLMDLPGSFDLVVEASAEPSVHAGTGGQSPDYLLDTNLVGTLNCLEFARKNSGGMIFLSTSRVYSIPKLKEIPLVTKGSRFEIDETKVAANHISGLSKDGISEDFPIIGSGFRSLYGTTKFCSELFLQEYAENFNFPCLVNRCGVIAGPGQFGKTDQGVYTLWIARHFFGGELGYFGFGGLGLQVRDLLHPDDLFSLIKSQMESISQFRAPVFAVGGGQKGSTSLLEYTKIAESITGNSISIKSQPQTAAVDIPYFVTDHGRTSKAFDWAPRFDATLIAGSILDWLKSNRKDLEPLFQN